MSSRMLSESITKRLSRRRGVPVNEANEDPALTPYSVIAEGESVGNHPCSDNIISQHSVGSLDGVCEHCRSLYFKDEVDAGRGRYMKCCNDGAIVLPGHRGVPDILEKYIKGEHVLSDTFLRDIRRYNNCLSLASLQYKEMKFSGSGPPVVVLNGEVRHYASPLLGAGTNLAFAEYFVMDPADAVRSRRASKFGTDCLGSILTELDSTLRECNPFVTAYKMMHEVVREAEADHGEVQNIRMWLVSNVGDNVRYIEGVRVGANTSRVVHNEVAIVYSGQDDFPDMKRELCIYNRNSAATLINTLSPVCDPLCYTLLFPYGDRGYHVGLRAPAPLSLF
jgi:hypothetical protein